MSVPFMDFGAVPLCSVVFIESGRDCERREGSSECGTWKAYKKRAGTERRHYTPRRRLSRSSYKWIGIPKQNVLLILTNGSLRHRCIVMNFIAVYPRPRLWSNTPLSPFLSCLSMVGQALNFPLLSHSPSLTKSVVKLTAVSVCQSESERYKSTHFVTPKTLVPSFSLPLILPTGGMEFLAESRSPLYFALSSLFV